MPCPVTSAKRLDTPDSLDLRMASFSQPLEAKFDVFLTVDQGLEYQQNLTTRKIGIIILLAKSNRLKDLLPLAPACLSGIESVGPGQILKVNG
jgi:hypothetical protein